MYVRRVPVPEVGAEKALSILGAHFEQFGTIDSIHIQGILRQKATYGVHIRQVLCSGV